MTHRVGPKGQVVIPKGLRDGDHVSLRPARRRPALRGRFGRTALTDDLMAQRRADRERELAG